MPLLLRTGLLALVAVLAFPAGAAGSGGLPSNVTPTRVHLLAEEAAVVRGLLSIENSLTYDAVALRPSRGALARRIRSQNTFLIGLCDAIIGDDARISRAERELRRAHVARDFDVSELFNLVEASRSKVTSTGV